MKESPTQRLSFEFFQLNSHCVILTITVYITDHVQNSYQMRSCIWVKFTFSSCSELTFECAQFQFIIVERHDRETKLAICKLKDLYKTINIVVTFFP